MLYSFENYVYHQCHARAEPADQLVGVALGAADADVHHRAHPAPAT